MNAPDTIRDGKVVALHYRLRLADGTEITDTHAEEPVTYLHGADDIVPGLERELTGRAVGERLTVVVRPEDGYGVHDPDAVETMPRDAFPPDLELMVGDQLTGEDEDGEVVPMRVLDIEGDSVRVDMNHPLAGETLHYEIEIVALRDATHAELDHGHVHDADTPAADA